MRDRTSAIKCLNWEIGTTVLHMVEGVMVDVCTAYGKPAVAHGELPGVKYGGSFVDFRLGLLCPNQGLSKSTVLLDDFLERKCSRAWSLHELLCIQYQKLVVVMGGYGVVRMVLAVWIHVDPKFIDCGENLASRR